ncbi:MAG TPA: rhodanese-like domain-containing protein [Chitinophagaceae bacterium]|nr:rhodanese-like domain-containing protein [Chitinophagaceae bacterium]
MKKIFLLSAIILACINAAMAGDGNVIVSAQWVKDNMNDRSLVILQVNFLKLDYDKEHIAGARFLWPAWLAADSPEGSFNPPDAKAATKVLRELGINKDSKIVLCHTKADVSVTARMFATLEYLGLQGKVYFLNGGLEAWKKAGFAVTNEAPAIKKGNYTASINPVLVDKNYVLASLQSSSSVVVDARMKKFYDGDPTGNPRDGHITGAKNIPYTDLIDSTNTIKPQEVLQNYFQPAAPDKEKEIVSYCFIGQTASVVYLAGRQLGYKIKIYDGSMQEWSRIESLPMEKTKKE